MSTFALAIGVGTQNKKGEWLEVFYPKPILNPSEELVNATRETLGYVGGNQALSLSSLRQVVPRRLMTCSQPNVSSHLSS